MRPLFLSWLLLLSLASAPALASGTLILTEHSSGTALNAYMDVFEDQTGALGIEQIASLEFAERFSPALGKNAVGFSPHPWWIRIRLTRTSQAPSQWWLENASLNVRDLRVYLPHGDTWQERLSGEQVAFAQGRDHPMRSFVFKLPPVGEEGLTLYVRSLNPAGNLFPLSVWQLADLQTRSIKENLIYGLLYGATFALLLYNLCLLTIFRDPSYFWYVLVTFVGLLIALCTSGHGFQYLWPDQPVPFWLDRTTLPSLWSILLVQFTMVLLYTHQGLKWTHWLFWGITLAYVLTIALNYLGFVRLAAQSMSLIPIVGIPTALGCAIYRSRDFLPARFYLLGYSVVFACGVTMIMRSAGLVTPHPIIAYLFPFSIAIESLLFAFALAYRIQLLRQEKEQALKLADAEKTARIHQVQHNAAYLQYLVDERTHELAQANNQLRHREQALEQAAYHDSLTGLPNRRYLLQHVQEVLSYVDRQRSQAALMLLDLDHFKPINDAFGHDAGDQVLRVMAQRFRDNIRSHDRVARLGGDEFAILISGPNAAQHAGEVAERLLKPQSQYVSYADLQLEVGLSIGIAEYPLHAPDFDRLYQLADQALYQAKRSGRSCYRRYEPSGKAWVPEPSL